MSEYQSLLKALEKLHRQIDEEHILNSLPKIFLMTLKAISTPYDQLACLVLRVVKKSGLYYLHVVVPRNKAHLSFCIGHTLQKGWITQILEKAKPHFITTISDELISTKLVDNSQYQSVYALPLLAGEVNPVIWLLVHPESSFFTPEMRALAEILAAHVETALHNARTHQAQVERVMKTLEIQNITRKKLARELHNGPTQSVAALAMRVNYARRLISRDVKAAGEELKKIEDLARQSSRDIRYVLFTLHPQTLETHGLVTALESLAEIVQQNFQQNVITEFDGNLLKNLDFSQREAIFYITQEAIRNAHRHAQAKNVWLRIKAYKKDIAMIEIEDDGIGFRMESTESARDKDSSSGLENIRNRTEWLGGVLTIETTPGRGTCLRLLLPLTEEARKQLHQMG